MPEGRNPVVPVRIGIVVVDVETLGMKPHVDEVAVIRPLCMPGPICSHRRLSTALSLLYLIREHPAMLRFPQRLGTNFLEGTPTITHSVFQ